MISVQKIVKSREQSGNPTASAVGGCQCDGKASFELACGDAWPEITTKLMNVFENSFEFTPSVSAGDGALHRIRLNSQCFVQYLLINNILKQKAGSIILPDFIFKNYSLFVSFYSGIFDADGYASGKKKGYVLASIDYNVVFEIQILLLSCGIVSRIHSENRSKKGWNTLYSLSICGAYSQEKLVNVFQECVKINNLRHVSARECIVSPYNSKTFNIKYNDYPYCPSNTEYLSIRTIDRLNADRKNDEEIPNSLFRSQVIKIEKSHKKVIKFSGISSIWANGFIVS